MGELHLFDFDGTLFKSPDRPKDWAASKSWAYDPQSLDYPCVPFKPGTESQMEEFMKTNFGLDGEVKAVRQGAFEITVDLPLAI